MRAKSEIMESLTSRMSSSDVWKKLKNGLLGRELLALGAEIISESENVKDTMLLQLNPETADKYGLYMLSQMNEIPITNVKPSSVVVEMLPNIKSFAPYELRFSVGNVTFYNIEYTMQGKTVSLLNGTHKCYVRGSGISSPENTVADGENAYFYDGGESYSGIKLGNAYPDSIAMYDENNMEIPRYTSDNALSEVINVRYKVVVAADGEIYIRFICNEGYTEPDRFRIEWLDHSSDDFDIDDTLVKVDNTNVAEIKYYSVGNVDDLNYMRLQLKKEMSKYNGLNTPVSIERYVKGLPYVLDAKCVKNEDGEVCVYIKPSSYLDLKSYLDFSEIAAHIALNSIMFPKIKVKTAAQIKFGIRISGVEDKQTQNSIKKMLQTEMSYKNTSFNYVVNVNSVISEIYEKFGIIPNVSFFVKEMYNPNRGLSFKPVPNTLKLLDNNDSIVAWEEESVLYGTQMKASDFPFGEYDVKGVMGTMFLLCLRKYPVLEEGDVVGYMFKVTDKNRFYLYDAKTNVLKPFDSCIQSLIRTNTNSSLKYSAYDGYNQSLGAIYDIEFLSTNNNLVVHIVLDDDRTQKDNDVYIYWNENNTTNLSFYENDMQNADEMNADYKSKFQSYYFFDNPIAFKKMNNEYWNPHKNCIEGIPSEMNGLYRGLRNITDDYVRLDDVKSNWFVYNNKDYYVSDIYKDRVIVTDGIKELNITINGTFLGMIPYEGALYVITNSYITKITNFTGLKSKEEIFLTYKDSQTVMTINQICREFDNQIIFETTENEWYSATGFEVEGNMIFFKNMSQIFDDIQLEGCIIGGCTEEGASLYKRVEKEVDDEQSGGKVTEIGYVFYYYDFNDRKTLSFDKTSTATEHSEEEVVKKTSTTTPTVRVNLFDGFWNTNWLQTINTFLPSPYTNTVNTLYNRGYRLHINYDHNGEVETIYINEPSYYNGSSTQTDNFVIWNPSDTNELYLLYYYYNDKKFHIVWMTKEYIEGGEVHREPWNGGHEWATICNKGKQYYQMSDVGEYASDTSHGWEFFFNYLSSEGSAQSGAGDNYKNKQYQYLPPIFAACAYALQFYIGQTSSYKERTEGNTKIKDYFGYVNDDNVTIDKSESRTYDMYKAYDDSGTNSNFKNMFSTIRYTNEPVVLDKVRGEQQGLYCNGNDEGEIGSVKDKFNDDFANNPDCFASPSMILNFKHVEERTIIIHNNTIDWKSNGMINTFDKIGYFDDDVNNCVFDKPNRVYSTTYDSNNIVNKDDSYLVLDDNGIVFI